MRLVFRNPGGFFENRAPIFGPRAEDLVDPALFHDGVGAATDAGIGEKCLDVFQPNDGFIEQVFREPVAINTARDAHLVPVHAQLARAIAEREADFRVADRFARIGAVKNDVRHFAAAERFRRLLAKNPAHGIEDVGFAAAVRPDDRGYAFVEIENGFIDEGFKAEKLERLEVHAARGRDLLNSTARGGKQ